MQNFESGRLTDVKLYQTKYFDISFSHEASSRVPTVREKSGKNDKNQGQGKSGNFEFIQENLKFWQKSGKSQRILVSEVRVDK